MEGGCPLDGAGKELMVVPDGDTIIEKFHDPPDTSGPGWAADSL